MLSAFQFFRPILFLVYVDYFGFQKFAKVSFILNKTFPIKYTCPEFHIERNWDCVKSKLFFDGEYIFLLLDNIVVVAVVVNSVLLTFCRIMAVSRSCNVIGTTSDAKPQTDEY